MYILSVFTANFRKVFVTLLSGLAQSARRQKMHHQLRCKNVFLLVLIKSILMGACLYRGELTVSKIETPINLTAYYNTQKNLRNFPSSSTVKQGIKSSLSGRLTFRGRSERQTVVKKSARAAFP